jgi:hypothetical protein
MEGQSMSLAARVSTLALTMLVCAAGSGWAGVYTDDLSKCLVSSTTPEDKTNLVRWMFAAMSLHPEVSSLSTVTPEQRTEISHVVAGMIERLLTEGCRPQYRDAVRYEGQQSVQMSFQVLGQVAGRSLFDDPSVNTFMAEFGKYVDGKKLEAAAEPEPQ